MTDAIQCDFCGALDAKRYASESTKLDGLRAEGIEVGVSAHASEPNGKDWDGEPAFKSLDFCTACRRKAILKVAERIREEQ